MTTLVGSLGPWTLAALFVVVFCETGLVVTPFLPDDNLMFATGAVAALAPEHLPLGRVLLVLFPAATLGDAVNSEVGRHAGRPRAVWLERRPGGTRHLAAARRFFESKGGRAVVLARFLPVFRTLVPFVAGAAAMTALSALADRLAFEGPQHSWQ